MAGKKNKLHSRPPFPCHLLFSAPSTHTQYQLHNKLPAFTISHVNIRVLVGATAWTLIPMWNINRLPSKCAICKSIYNWAKCDTYRIRHWFSNFLCCRPAFFRIRPPPLHQYHIYRFHQLVHYIRFGLLFMYTIHICTPYDNKKTNENPFDIWWYAKNDQVPVTIYFFNGAKTVSPFACCSFITFVHGIFLEMERSQRASRQHTNQTIFICKLIVIILYNVTECAHEPNTKWATIVWEIHTHANTRSILLLL